MKEINLKRAMALYAELEEANAIVRNAANARRVYPTAEAAARDAKDAELTGEIAAALVPALNEVQKRATARIIFGMDILAALAEVEKTLGITKKALDGVTVCVDKNARSFPNAYKGRPESTQFRARYKGGCWRVTDIYRDTVKAPSKRVEVTLTDAAKAAIIERMSAWR